jgi:DNA-directed RNA polymerase omega subunit
MSTFITSDDAIAALGQGNKFYLPLVAAARFRELNSGSARLILSKSGNKTVALEEIEAGLVGVDTYTKTLKVKKNV